MMPVFFRKSPYPTAAYLDLMVRQSQFYLVKAPVIAVYFLNRRPPGLVPSCQEAGILGAVAGIIGTLQANEVLKYILGMGNLLSGRLLVFNALDLSFRLVKVPKNTNCPVCGENPTITKLIDYEEFCQLRRKEER
jgi:adenylyltransferase/sulfurtransferase